MDNLFIGVDIGGTNVKFGVMNSNGVVLDKSSIKIADDIRFSAVMEKIVSQIKTIISSFSNALFCGIGLGIPGLIDAERGVVVCSGNLNWWNEDVISVLKSNFDLPIRIGNDANVATLGEFTFGIGKSYNSCVMLTLGTGVGSGIIIDGKIYSGNASAGAELGHMVIEAFGRPCTCGGNGCFEAYASATALKDQTKKAMLNNLDSKMWEIGDVSQVSGKTAFKYAEIDCTAKQVVDSYVEYLAIGITNIANIFRPDAIILGGGVSYEGERLLNPLKERLAKKIFAGDLGPKVELVLATLRNDAGFMGACALNMN